MLLAHRVKDVAGDRAKIQASRAVHAYCRGGRGPQLAQGWVPGFWDSVPSGCMASAHCFLWPAARPQPCPICSGPTPPDSFVSRRFSLTLDGLKGAPDPAIPVLSPGETPHHSLPRRATASPSFPHPDGGLVPDRPDWLLSGPHGAGGCLTQPGPLSGPALGPSPWLGGQVSAGTPTDSDVILGSPRA